jgi:hypothetical protein
LEQNSGTLQSSSLLISKSQRFFCLSTASFQIVTYNCLSLLLMNVSTVQGIFDLFWLPIEQYQKDGRIVRGLQRGAQSFTARTALAALEITSRLIYLLQVCRVSMFTTLCCSNEKYFIADNGRNGLRHGVSGWSISSKTR